MNCKQGDLAVIIRSDAGNEGKIVRCLRLIPNKRWNAGGTGTIFEAHSWEIDQSLRGMNGEWSPFIEDRKLRPIRDNDGEDEALQWAGKPQEVTA